MSTYYSVSSSLCLFILYHFACLPYCLSVSFRLWELLICVKYYWQIFSQVDFIWIVYLRVTVRLQFFIFNVVGSFQFGSTNNCFVVVVKKSACSPYTPTIRVRIPLKPTVFSVKFVFERNKNKQKRWPGFPHLKKHLLYYYIVMLRYHIIYRMMKLSISFYLA